MRIPIGIDLGNVNVGTSMARGGIPRIVEPADASLRTPTIARLNADGNLLIGYEAGPHSQLALTDIIVSVKVIVHRPLPDEEDEDKILVDLRSHSPAQVAAVILDWLRRAAKDRIECEQPWPGRALAEHREPPESPSRS